MTAKGDKVSTHSSEEARATTHTESQEKSRVGQEADSDGGPEPSLRFAGKEQQGRA